MISRSESVRDLWVHMSNDRTFQVHIKNMVTLCRRVAWWTPKTFRTRERETLLPLWKTFVLSRLDNCSQLWSSRECETNWKSNTALMHKEYWFHAKGGLLKEAERAQSLFPEEKTRVVCGNIFWKILTDLDPNFGIDSHANPRTGRYCKMSKVPSTPSKRNKHYGNSVALKVPKSFNILRGNLKILHVANLDIFKECLEKFLSEIQDEPITRQETQKGAALSNSLLHQNQYRKPHHVTTVRAAAWPLPRDEIIKR